MTVRGLYLLYFRLIRYSLSFSQPEGHNYESFFALKKSASARKSSFCVLTFEKDLVRE